MHCDYLKRILVVGIGTVLKIVLSWGLIRQYQNRSKKKCDDIQFFNKKYRRTESFRRFI
jgi:hypothetical protein